VEEMLLNYRGALAYLEQALAASSTHDRRDLKKLAQYRTLLAEWDSLNLSPTELKAMGAYLKSKEVGPHERSRKWTIDWIRTHCPDREDTILRGLDTRGAYSDYQVLVNVVKG
jgi:hypothetical protein